MFTSRVSTGATVEIPDPSEGTVILDFGDLTTTGSVKKYGDLYVLPINCHGNKTQLRLHYGTAESVMSALRCAIDLYGNNK